MVLLKKRFSIELPFIVKIFYLFYFPFHYQGVQAQTVANFYGAMDADLTVIPVINKVSLQRLFARNLISRQNKV